MRTTKVSLYQIVVCLFVSCLLISNVLASKVFSLGNIVLPAAVIVFPIVYIVNDLITEVYGFKKAKNAIFFGFAINLLAVIAYAVAIVLPAPEYATEGAKAFAVTLGSTGRILLASFLAYIVGSLVNAYIMEKLKAKAEKHLMFRCVASTLAGEGLDAFIFISIAFFGTMPMSTLVIMVAAQAMFKTLFEVAVYPVTKKVIGMAKALPE